MGIPKHHILICTNNIRYNKRRTNGAYLHIIYRAVQGRASMTKQQAKCLQNLLTGEKFYDTLHLKVASNIQELESNNAQVCNGASMSIYGLEGEQKFATGHDDKAEIEATIKIMKECLEEIKMDTSAKTQRLDEIEAMLYSVGSFDLSFAELEVAAKMAWKNAPRCPGRIQWNNLKLRDYRHVFDVESAFEALCGHIEYSTNDGNIRPAITVFPPRRHGQEIDPIRIWNKFLISHAGYNVDGEIIGDQGNLKFTKLCESLGWKGKGGHFDVLPLVLSSAADDGQPRYFDIPEEIVLKFKIQHPKYPKLSQLGIEWYALPAVSSMSLNVGMGGIFPGTAFSGWYSLTEVAVRNLLDEQRYNLTHKLLAALDMDDLKEDIFVRDRVATELCNVVLHSFNTNHVSVVDHHAQSRQFMEFFRNEHRTRGGCPADWVWINPPISGSLTEVFHQEMLNYLIQPCFNYQKPMVHSKGQSKISLKVISKAMMFYASLISKTMKKRKKVMIYYATETGTSRRLAKEMRNMLRSSDSINPIILNLGELGIDDITQGLDDENVSLSLFIVSTFGSGDSPADAKNLAGELDMAIRSSQAKQHKNGRYSVFALGSSSYPQTFCFFGKYIDSALELLGGNRLLPLAIGDEAGGKQFSSFTDWMKQIAQALRIHGAEDNMSKVEWHPCQKPRTDLQNYSRVYGKEVCEVRVVSKTYLSSRVLMLKLDLGNQGLKMNPGDHLAIFPNNITENVSKLVDRLTISKSDKLSPGYLAIGGDDYGPVATPADLLHKFYDIHGPITSDFLQRVGAQWNKHCNRDKVLSKCDIFDLDPNLQADFKTFLASLQPMKPRLYSLANDPSANSTVDLVVTLNYLDEEASVLGVCSRYLKELEEGDTLFSSPHPSQIFHSAVKRPDLPVLMVANGSGIAPFRSLWQSRHKQGMLSESTVLLYGCRTKKDNLFADEYCKSHRRITVFSRQEGAKKTYVQDLLAQDEGRRLFRDIIINRGGIMLICGSALMSQGVKSAVNAILQEDYGVERGKEILERLRQEKRYQEEIFG